MNIFQTSSNELHFFDNGISVHKKHLLDIQIDRYDKINRHEPEEESIINSILDSLPGEEGTFLDIGAAIGYYLFLVALKKPKFKFYAFEPLKEHRKYLLENVRHNTIQRSNIIIRPEALYDKVGSVTFKPHRYGSKVLSSNFSLSNFFGKNRVKSITLDKFFQEEKLMKVELIKVDVQGGEINVLNGGVEVFRSKKIANIIIGTHSKSIHIQVRNFLNEMKYSIVVDKEDSEFQPDGIIMAKIN